MPPIDRREYLKYSGSAAVAPLVAATDEIAADAARRTQQSNPSGDVLPPRDLRVEYAEDPLGVHTQSHSDAVRAPDDSPNATDAGPGGAGAGSDGPSDATAGDDPAGDGTVQRDELPGAGWTDYTFESTFTVENRAAGFVFRAQDPENFYLWQIIVEGSPDVGPVNAILRTHVFVDGEFVILENVPFVLGDPNAQHTCRIDLEGEQITTSVDGDLLHTTVDPTHEAGTIGFWADAAEHVLVDEVTVVDPDGEELFATDFSYDAVRYFSGGRIVDDELSLQGVRLALRADRESSTEPDPPSDGEPDEGTSTRPRLSWQFAPARRGQRQGAYRILVASSRANLAQDVGDKWDSGRVSSARSTNVEYGGEPLEAGEQVYWKVRVWDGDGRRPSQWSEPATWEMGLLEAGDWEADWIGHPDQEADRWTDYTLDLEFTVEEGAFGALFRARDASRNFYLAEIRVGDDPAPTFRLRVREHGEWTALTEVPIAHVVPSGAEHQPHRLEIECTGSVFRTSIDGTLVDLTADDTHAFGRVGFRVGGDEHARVDDLQVTDSDGDVLYEDDFSDPETERHYSGGEVTDGALDLDGTGLVPVQPFRLSIPPEPLFRTEVSLDADVEDARAYVSGLGSFELQLNGERVGERTLEPARTDYEETVLYTAYDVTEFLRQGQNAVGVAAGRGRYGEPLSSTFNWANAPWWSDPELRCQIEVDLADGTTRVIGTGDDWSVADGPTRFDSLYGGEDYDALKAPAGWTESGYDDADWRGAGTVEGPDGDVTAQRVQPTEAVETIEPVEVTEPDDGVYVFDVGQMIAGWTRLTVEGPAGTEVELSMGEKLADDGTVYNQNNHIPGRMQVDRYVLEGDGVETWEPRFTYKGFRYVQVEGYPGEPTLDAIEAVVVHTAVETGDESGFSCSKPILNRIHENTRWAMLNNSHSVPEDTPAREKNAYGADAQVVVEAAMYDFSMPRFYTKWLRDWADAQRENGRLPTTAPNAGDWTYAQGGETTPGWGSAYVLIPWWLYQYYGDERVLAEHYEGMKQYVERMNEVANEYVVESGLGDWNAPGGGAPPPEGPAITSTAYFYRDTEILASVARLLGRDQDAATFEERAEQIRDAFNAEFLDSDDVYRTGQTPEYRQTSNVVPLAFDMVPEDREAAVVENLVQDVEETQNGHLNTGCLGTKYLLQVLTEYGHHDLAYTVATRTTYPSWGHWITEFDATALFERWDESSGIFSRDHQYFGSVDEWFYQYVAGIREPAEPGFAHVEIEPELVDDLEWAEATTETVRGDVTSQWERIDDGLRLAVTIPGNAGATVRVPDLGHEDVTLRESGQVVWADGQPAEPLPEGVETVHRGDDAVVVEVGAGEYAFDLVADGT